MTILSLILFAVFGLLLAGMYIAIRREWFKPGLIAGFGVALSVVLMIAVSLAQGNQVLQAVVVGTLIGGLFSSATLAVAWYFHRNELRARYADESGE
jgi:hypothetical protein